MGRLREGVAQMVFGGAQKPHRSLPRAHLHREAAPDGINSLACWLTPEVLGVRPVNQLNHVGELDCKAHTIAQCEAYTLAAGRGFLEEHGIWKSMAHLMMHH